MTGLTSPLARGCRSVVLLSGTIAGFSIAAIVRAQPQPATSETTAPSRSEKIRFLRGEALLWAQPGVAIPVNETRAGGCICRVKRALQAQDQYLLAIRRPDGTAASEAQTLQAISELQRAGKYRWVGPNYVRPFLGLTPDVDRAQSIRRDTVRPTQDRPERPAESNLVIALLDSGIDETNPEMRGRIIGSRNFIDDSDEVTDYLGHGTAVAKSALAATIDREGGAGVKSPGCKLYIAKVGDQFGQGPNASAGAVDSAVIDALTTIRTKLNRGGKRLIVCLPFGKPDRSDTPDSRDPFNAAIMAAASEGVVICAAAGNTRGVGNAPISPANLASISPNVLCVAAAGQNDEPAPYSQARPYTTVAVRVGGDRPSGNVSRQAAGSPGPGRGTSLAAASCAGFVVTLLSAGADPLEVKHILTDTADAGGRDAQNPEIGFGVIDAAAALKEIANGVRLLAPPNGGIVYGPVTVKLGVTDSAGFQDAVLTIDDDPTIVARAHGAPYTLTWDPRDNDPDSSESGFIPGRHRLHVTVTTSKGRVLLTRTIKLDDPV